MRLSQFLLPASCMTTGGRDSPARQPLRRPVPVPVPVRPRPHQPACFCSEAAPQQRQNVPGPIITPPRAETF